jgi:hypothetical protein
VQFHPGARMEQITEKDKARFWAKVDRSPRYDECWLWLGKLNRGGYGRFYYGGKQVLAHRYSFKAVFDFEPDTIDHLCRNRACVNPMHLQSVTITENVMRGTGLAATNATKTECNLGHAYSTSNTRLERGTNRRCRKCAAENKRKHRKAAT